MGYCSTDSSTCEVNQRCTGVKILWTAVEILVCDIFWYTCILPLIATYIAGSICKLFDWGPYFEIVLTIAVTVLILYIAFSCWGEQSYWKCLFGFDEYCQKLLTVRDVVNSGLFIVCLLGLASSVESMIEDHSMKSHYLNEGTSYVFFNSIFKWLNFDPSLISQFGLKLPRGTGITDLNFGENERFEHAGTYMLFWAMLTATTAKMVYFNTLFTYLRAMDIFISLNPIFEDDFVESVSKPSSRFK